MLRVRTFAREDVSDSPLMETILRLDRDNMESILAELGIEMPIERRKAAFERPGTIVVVEDQEDGLAGYLEFGPASHNPNEIYVSAIQIARKHRNGIVLLKLIRYALATGAFHKGQVLKTHVQNNNETALKIFERLGFRFTEKPGSSTLEARMICPSVWPAASRSHRPYDSVD